MVGALLTGVVQSSAATLGITITLATQGLIDYPTAVALVSRRKCRNNCYSFISFIRCKFKC